MIYMFNELSQIKVNSREDVCNILEIFLKACVHASEIGFDEMRLHGNSLANLYQITTHEKYTIGTWLKDERVNTDLREKFREIVTTFPLIDKGDKTGEDLFETSTFHKTINGQKSQVWGLGAAYIYDTLSISLRTHEEWNRHETTINHYYLNENLTEVVTDVLVKHFSNTETLNEHLAWWHNYQIESLKKSEDLWKRREEFFPKLILCGEVEMQLKKIGVSKTLSQIIDRLTSLNNYVKDWQTNDFNYEDANRKTNLRISPESNSTLKKFGSSRMFLIPNHGKELFNLHIKTGDLRFHFFPDNLTKKIYIGYIGKHLRTASEG